MKVGLSIGCVLAVLILALILWLVSLPFTYAEMDLNKNGWLGVSEIMYFFDHGTRTVSIEGGTCTEYYALKDGLPLKVVCSD